MLLAATRRRASRMAIFCFNSSSSMMRPCSRSTRNMRPGCSRPLSITFSGGNVEHADLGRHDDQVVLGDVIARRPQAVAIEHRADVRAVGEGDRGRAVPRLHQAGVIFVKRLLLLAHRRVAGPRLGDHHHDRVRQASGPPAPASPARCRTSPNRCPISSMIGRIFLMSVAEQVRLRTGSRGRASS